MTETVCLPKVHLIIIFMVFIGLTSWYIHNDKKKHLDEPDYKYTDKIIDEVNKQINNLNIINNDR